MRAFILQYILGFSFAAFSIVCVAAQAQNYQGVLAVYEANRREGLPNYVTQDIFLLAYADLSRQELKDRELSAALQLAEWLSAIQANKDKETEDKADPSQRAASNLVDVLAALGAADVNLSKTAAAELALIDAAEGIVLSPLWGAKLDYSQFKPRGRYTESEEASRYFRQLRYLNNILFYVNASNATGVTADTVAQHMGMLKALMGWGAADEQYQALLASTAIGGTLDDFSLADAKRVQGSDLATGLRELAAKEDRYPQVLQGFLERSELAEGETPEQALLGVRLIPARVGADTLAMQVLVNDAGTWTGEGEQPFSAAAGAAGIVKGWPTANEVLAAMGSEAAGLEVQSAGDDQFANYKQAMNDASQSFELRPAIEQATWSLYRAVAASREDTASALATARALWTLQRHETILYSKQSYTMVDRSMPPLVDRSSSTIEPAVEVYTALAALVALREEAAPDSFKPRWAAFSALLAEHAAYAQQVLAETPLTPEQGDALANIDVAIKAIGVEQDKPRVVDVHTHPGEGAVLQEATAEPLVKKIGSSRGAYLSHREFKQPISDRLTDQQWQKQLVAEKVSP